MKISFLTNNSNTFPLSEALKKYGETVTVYSDHENIKGPVDCIISYNYRKIIGPEIIGKCPAINLHIGYLPWNKGAHPVVWSALNGTPMGVTIHVMTNKLDSGEILIQRETSYSLGDTLEELYNKLQKSIQDLFMENWHRIRADIGDAHRVKDLESLTLRNGWQTTVKQLREDNR